MGRTFRAALLLVLLCIIGSAAFISYKVFFSNPARSIPLLKGSSVIEAVQTLERMGIKARVEEEDSALPRGTVIGQWPETGVKLRADKAAILKVSRGSEKLPLPDLRGLTEKQAVARLEEAGFVLGEVQKINHERPAGVVVAQNPAAPVSISQSREVGLLISLGPAAASGTVIVPDLVQRDEKTAESLARESSLRPRLERVYDNSSPQGMVVSMNPAAGQHVPRGADVYLRVASWDRKLAPQNDDEKSGSGAKGAVEDPGVEPDTAAAQNRKGDDVVAQTAQDDKKQPPAETKKKVASIRYQAPPVSNQTLVIELIDKEGEHTLVNRKAKAGEYIKINAPYVGEAVVTIYLGGNFVWQDRYN